MKNIKVVWHLKGSVIRETAGVFYFHKENRGHLRGKFHKENQGLSL